MFPISPMQAGLPANVSEVRPGRTPVRLKPETRLREAGLP